MSFSLTGTRTGDEVTLHVAGELDLATAPELREAGEGALADPQFGTLRLDISEVSFMDSTGLGVMIGLRNDCETAGKRLIIADPSPIVARLLELSGLTSVFDIEVAD